MTLLIVVFSKSNVIGKISKTHTVFNNSYSLISFLHLRLLQIIVWRWMQSIASKNTLNLINYHHRKYRGKWLAIGMVKYRIDICSVGCQSFDSFYNLHQLAAYLLIGLLCMWKLRNSIELQTTFLIDWWCII